MASTSQPIVMECVAVVTFAWLPSPDDGIHAADRLPTVATFLALAVGLEEIGGLPGVPIDPG
ncbi:MAG: hypothetical protein KF752_02510 [Pirellulaceae bacterium]|nr:hypothetical protein [Pirellulaceae bacterium]